MSRRRSRTQRLVLLGAVSALVATGCVHQGAPGVAVNRVDANLVFGVKTALDQAPSQSLADLASSGFVDFVIPELNIVTKRQRSFEIPEDEVAQLCPEAPADAVAPEVPPVGGVGSKLKPPKEGFYKYLVTGTKVSNTGFRQRQFTQIQYRRVQNVTLIPESVNEQGTSYGGGFSFQMVQSAGEDAKGKPVFSVITFKVNNNPIVVTSPGATSGLLPLPTQGEPERGIVVSALDVVDQNGNAVPGVTPFHPAFGYVIMPLPVIPGEHYVTQATDETSRRTIARQVDITSKLRMVDACGSLVATWGGSGSENDETFTRASAFHNDFEYAIATQFGGLPVYEKTISGLGSVPNRVHVCTDENTVAPTTTSSSTTTTAPKPGTTTTTAPKVPHQCATQPGFENVPQLPDAPPTPLIFEGQPDIGVPKAQASEWIEVEYRLAAIGPQEVKK